MENVVELFNEYVLIREDQIYNSFITGNKIGKLATDLHQVLRGHFVDEYFRIEYRYKYNSIDSLTPSELFLILTGKGFDDRTLIFDCINYTYLFLELHENEYKNVAPFQLVIKYYEFIIAPELGHFTDKWVKGI